MQKYIHRERVIATLNHQTADRVPLDLMGNASMLLDDTYIRLRDRLGLTEIAPVRSGSTANYYDERILKYLDIDFRRLFLRKSPANQVTRHSDGSFTDIWGVRYRQIGPFVNAIDHPLAGVTSVRDLDNYRWPTATDLYTADGIGELARNLYEQTGYALVARNPLSEGFLDRPCHLMGMSEFMIFLLTEPELVNAIIARLLELYKGVYSMFLDAVGPYVQMVEVADDLGGNDHLLISPALYRSIFKPAEKELYAMIHEKAPQAALFHHTDGAVFDIIPDLIEVGVNVLNPVQTSVGGMNARRLKATFGRELVFHGAIEGIEGDIDSEVVAGEVRSRIDDLAVGGGYIVAPCNHMIDVKPENILEMYATARQYGRYR
ncbi:MAG: uroporphyrinogen decarboxylase family protein [Candidatus Neomarinimicrobiota bacterium]